MKYSAYLSDHQAELDFLHLIKDVIIPVKGLSKYAGVSVDAFLEISTKLQQQKMPVVLDWDILMTQDQFEKCLCIIERIPKDSYQKIRISDVGALEYIRSRLPEKRIQFCPENGGHNISSINCWGQNCGDQLDRIVLSNQLSQKRIRAYKNELGIEFEILGVGQIPLYYSSRFLLSPIFGNTVDKNGEIEVLADSEEGHHSGFSVLENESGTILFNAKDIYLIDKLPEIIESKMDVVLIDLRSLNSKNLAKELWGCLDNYTMEDATNIAKKWPRPTIHGFWRGNNTDSLFKRIKKSSGRLKQSQKWSVGEVIDLQKDRYTAILLSDKSPIISNGDLLNITNPEGKDKNYEVSELRNFKFEKISNIGEGEVMILPYIRGAFPKSVVHLEKKEISERDKLI